MSSNAGKINQHNNEIINENETTTPLITLNTSDTNINQSLNFIQHNANQIALSIIPPTENTTGIQDERRERFIPVNSKKRPNRFTTNNQPKHSKTNMNSNPVETSNQYRDLSSLEDTSDCEMDYSISGNQNKRNSAKRTHKLNTNVTSTRNAQHMIHHNQPSTSTAQTAPQNQGMSAPLKIKKMPPIAVFNVDNKIFIQNLTTHLKHNNFFLQTITTNKSNIFTHNIADFLSTKSYLETKKINNFSRAPAETKLKNLVLKGVDQSFSNEDVKNAIEGLMLDIKLERVVSMRVTKKDLHPIFRIIHLSNDSEISTLMKTQYLLHQKVTWEKLRNNNYSQCHNCQRHGHTSKQCGMPYRCIKCPNAHNPGECPRIYNKDDTTEAANLDNPPYCTNCGEHGHPANSRSCRIFLNYIKSIEERRETAKHKSISFNNYINKNIKFSEITKNSFNNTNSFPPIQNTHINLQTQKKNITTNTNSKNTASSQNTLSQNLENLHTQVTNPYTKKHLYQKRQEHLYNIGEIISDPPTNFNVTNTHTHSNVNNFSFLQTECNEVLGMNLLAALNKINSFVATYKQIQDPIKKKTELTLFLFQLSSS